MQDHMASDHAPCQVSCPFSGQAAGPHRFGIRSTHRRVTLLCNTYICGQIKDQVDRAIGEAIRGVKLDWVAKDLSSIGDQLTEWSKLPDCFPGQSWAKRF